VVTAAGGARPRKRAAASARATCAAALPGGLDVEQTCSEAGGSEAPPVTEHYTAGVSAAPLTRGLPDAPLIAHQSAECGKMQGVDTGVQKSPRESALPAADEEPRHATKRRRRGGAAEREADELTSRAPAEDDWLVDGASLLQPSATQKMLIAQAFPESAAAAEFEAEKAKLVESEAAVGDEAPDLPGWGDWGGLGAKPSRRAEERRRSAAEARAQLLEEAARKRKDAALSHVIICEKRDKKAARFTTAGVPYPFTSREQFERSLRNPLGTDWNTAESHAALVAPRLSTVRGAIIEAIPQHRKAAAGKKADAKKKKKAV